MSTLIALCGHPESGKDEVADILSELWGVRRIDDGACLRDFAQRHLGLSHWETHTQDGKRCYSQVIDREWQNRKILGQLGAKLEELFGEHIMPWIAVQKTRPGLTYAFPSCRKTQGWFYKAQGGVVVEVLRPGTEPSGNDFDVYDPAAVDIVINNDGTGPGWRSRLTREVIQKLSSHVDHGGFDVVTGNR